MMHCSAPLLAIALICGIAPQVAVADDSVGMVQLTVARAAVDLSQSTSVGHFSEAASGAEAAHLSSFSGCQSNNKWTPKGDLHLIHIPRTMGSSIEMCNKEMPVSLNLSQFGGSDSNVKWNKDLRFTGDKLLAKLVNKSTVTGVFGDNHTESGKLTGVILGHDWQSSRMLLADQKPLQTHQLKWLKVDFLEKETQQTKTKRAWATNIRIERHCYLQHMPPTILALSHEQSSPYTQNGQNFCTVRHPYERLVSQFGFAEMFNFKVHEGGVEKLANCTVESMNLYLKQRLEDVLAGDLGLDDCHFVPQSLYVYGYDVPTGLADRSQKWCDNVLHFEKGSSDFNDLMKRYGYGLEMGTKHKASYSSRDQCAFLTVSHLSPEVRKLADELFKEDFELLGYKPSLEDPALTHHRDKAAY